MVVVVNMLDVAKTHGLEINLEKLQDELGCPVVGIVASRKKGIEELKQALDKQLSEPEAAANPIVFSADIENASWRNSC